MAIKVILTVTIIFAAAVSAEAVLYSDNYDVDSSAGWNINASSADISATFAFDYSTIGVPASPNGGGTTLGLRLAANISAPASTEAITLSPKSRNFSGNYMLKFDMWINANGPFPDGGSGSTEFLTAGIGYDDATVNKGGASGAGGWFAATGEGGSTRDYRAYKAGGEQFAESGQFFAGTSSAGGGAHNSSDPYYAAFGDVDVEVALAAQKALHGQQTGTTLTGSAGMAWHEVTITVDGAKAAWAIDGLNIAALDPAVGASFSLDGNISIGYMDIFSSVSDNPEVSFGLIDNLVVVPEPATIGLLLAGGIAFLRRRR